MKRLDFLGTLHLATPRFNAMDLYSFLLALGPEAVFEEREAAAPAEKPDASPGLEEEAVSAYAAARPVTRLPYDMAGWGRLSREAGYLSVEKDFFGALRRMAQEGRLRPVDMQALAALESSKRLYDDLFSLTMKGLNDAALPARLEAIEESQYRLAESACAAYPALSGNRARFSAIRKLVSGRRQAMAENILSALRRHRPQSAVIVCGIAEKGRLERALAVPAAREGYAIGNFWRPE